MENLMAKEMKDHLEEGIIPFWEALKDNEKGGYYGYMDSNLVVDKEATKGCILNNRILWFFSNAYMALKKPELLECAEHAYQFLVEHCYDHEMGGVYWSLTAEGEVEDSTKHTYNQAFAIYALASYYDASGKREALDYAYKIYEVIEKHCKDDKGYLEAFTRDFKPESNEKLSENGVMAEKTMNTLLHVYEGYTELLRVTGDENVAENIRFMLDIFADKVYNPELVRQEVFFDKDWNTLIDLHSYGHDIETSWLIDRGVHVLDDEAYTKKILPITQKLAQKIYERAYVDHSLLNECERGVDDTTRVWWVQAETVIGFVNEYEKSGDEKYLTAAEDVWDYIKTYVIDKRCGEWFWCVDKDHKASDKPIVEPWKCPYHNGRMCMEIMRRLGN